MKKLVCSIFLCLSFELIIAQLNDKTLSEEELIYIVKRYHPISLQASNAVLISETNVLKARGQFDPFLQLGNSSKKLDNLTYYNYQNADLKIPTWYGIDFGAGLEYVGGAKTDPQETQGSSSYAGISMPLLKNLVIDKRRAALQQAKVMVNQIEVERNAILNDLLYDALSQYWEWVQAYRKLTILKEVVQVNQQRLDFTKRMIIQGERPGIDSIEATTQLQYFLMLQNDAELEVKNALLQLSIYTWQDNLLPYDLPSNIQPSSSSNEIEYDLTSIKEYEDAMLASHPELELYKYKFQFLDINKKLKFQELLPSLNAKYNFISKGNSFVSTPVQSLFQNNYQYGLSFSMPLRLSDGRAEYKQAKLKIKETQYMFEYKRQSLLNKVRTYFNTLKVLQQQIILQKSLLENHVLLVKGEETRFSIGESSLFVVNGREQKRIETEQKLIESIAKYAKQKAAMKWVTGLLAQ